MTEERTDAGYEVVVVGGGPGGLTTALYATRLGHSTAVVDRGGGRHAAASHVHNVLGVSEETSGEEFAATAVAQLEAYGGDYHRERVESVRREGDRFAVATDERTLAADRVVLATGFTDAPPPVDDLRRFTGRGLHYCLHCDAYTLGGQPVFVLGHDEHAAHVAAVLLNFTADVDLLTNGHERTWGDDVAAQLAAYPIDVDDRPVERAVAEDVGDEQWLGGLVFADGERRSYAGGFAMYGRSYENGLARELGCALAADGAVEVDDRYQTSVEGVYAVGDLTHGQNQTPVAMGDGAAAGVALHRDLRTFPLDEPVSSAEEVPEPPGAPPALQERMRELRRQGPGVGMTPDDT